MEKKVSGEYITEGLTPQDGADSISDFDAKFSFASFTWNGDDKTGAKCAKQTKKQIKQYIQTKIDQEVKKRDNTPIGASKWKELGVKYGYYEYFRKEEVKKYKALLVKNLLK